MADAKPIKLASGKQKQFASTDTVPTANLGTGTANSSSFLRGDQTWAAPTADPSVAYARGTITIATGYGQNQIKNLTLSSTQRMTIEGTGRMHIN